MTIQQRFRQEQEVRAPLRRVATVPVTNVTNSNVTLFTVPDNRFFEVKHLGVSNISGSNLAVTVHVTSGSAANANKAYDAYVVWPNTSEDLDALAGSMLEPGDKIIAVTDNATGGNFWLWGELVEG